MAPRSSETETLEERRFSEFGSVDTQSAMLSDSLCYVCHCVMFVKNIKQENKAKIGSSLARTRQGAEHKANECKQGDKNFC